MVLRGIYNQPPRTTRTPAKVSHFDDPVPEDVDDLGLTPANYPLALWSVEVNVPVQPQGWLVAVYEPDEGLEAYVGLVLGVAEAERRGEGDDVVKVVERQVAAGDHGLDPSSVRREARPVEHRLYPVADAQYLHVRRSITSFGGAGTLRCAGHG